MTQHLHNCRVIIPTEGYGFSNDANAVLGTPSKAPVQNCEIIGWKSELPVAQSNIQTVNPTIVDAALNLRNPREMPHWDN